jgi:hypothetical protein
MAAINKHGVTCDQVYWWDPPIRGENEPLSDFLKLYFGYCFSNCLRADYTGFIALTVITLLWFTLLVVSDILWFLTFWTIIGYIVFLVLVMVFCILWMVFFIMSMISIIAAMATGGMSQPSDKVTAPETARAGIDWFRPPAQCGLGDLLKYCFANMTRADHGGLACWIFLLGAFQSIVCICYIIIILLCFVIIGFFLMIVYFILYVPIAIIAAVLYIGTFVDFIAALASDGPGTLSAKATATSGSA